MHFLNAGEIGTKVLIAFVDFRVRAPSSNEISPQSLTGGVVGQSKSGLCKHQKNIFEQF
jgi:hypothetical protein